MVPMWVSRASSKAPSSASFVAWAAKRKHMPALALPSSRANAPGAYADSEDRWAIARRLVRDDDLDVADRVAGALVVLYAQPLARIVSLSLDDVRHEHGEVVVALAGHVLELP